MLSLYHCSLIAFIASIVAIGMMVPRTAAARAFSVVGRRCQQPAAAFLLSMRTARNPASTSPLFCRPIHVSSNSDSQVPMGTVAVKTPSPVPNGIHTDVECSCDDCDGTTVATSSKNETTGDNHDDTDHSFHGAIHQVEHRASEKGGIELSRLMTEEAIKLLERSAERSALERRTLERAAERMTENMSERVGERALERSAERAAERMSKIAGERAFERGAELSAERTLEQVAGKSSRQAAKRVGKEATERIGERTVELSVERAAERAGERASERLAEQAIEKSLAKGVAHPLALTIPERVALRIGRGILIALPALGGIFALYLLKVDKSRAMAERTKGSRVTFMLFGGAAMTDGVDAVCHFAIAYGVFHKFGHHLLAQLEEVSLGCAFVSTFCAVMGEVIAYRRRKKLTMVGKEDG